MTQATSPAPASAGRTVAAPGFGHIDYRALPTGTNCEYLAITAADGGGSRGYLYSRGGEKTVACFMHPRGDQSRHYVMDRLLEAGFATFGQTGRWLNNDAGCIHEILLLDIAAGLRLLKDRGFEKIVLVGNSGGGALYTFYQAQASATPPERLKDTAGGQPLDLGAIDMPTADGLVLLAAHIGQGRFLMKCIDPSLTAEGELFGTDPSLDMYEIGNGFREPPASSCYASDFVERYRAGQRARVERLDRIARDGLAEQAAFKAIMTDPAFARIGEAERLAIQRRASGTKVMTIYRTDAALESCDLSLSPSQRLVGSLVSKRPDISNYALGGFAWVQTPQAWLSTWSGLSSRASTPDNIGAIRIPLLLLNYAGDNGIFPDEIEELRRRCPAVDKTVLDIAGDHYGLPTDPALPDPRLAAKEALRAWLAERF